MNASSQRRRFSSSRPSRTPITNYYGGNKTSDRSPFEKKVKKGRGRKLAFGALDILIISAVLAGLIYSLIVKPAPRLEVNDLSYHGQSTYQTALVRELKSIKNRNKMTLDERGIEASLKKQFPEIADVSVRLPLLGQTPTVKLAVAAPTFFLTSQGKVYILDSLGVAVSESKDLPKVKSLPTIDDQSGFEVNKGTQALSGSAVSFINSILAQSKRSKVPIKSLTLPPAAQELHVRTDDKSYFVKFYLGGDARQQIGQFLSARQQFSRSKIEPAQYLDVRVAGKIFYK
jgi:cell division septal protein FtsQ